MDPVPCESFIPCTNEAVVVACWSATQRFKLCRYHAERARGNALQTGYDLPLEPLDPEGKRLANWP